MRLGGMDLFWRILAAFSFDCFKDSTSSRSPTKPGSSGAGSLGSSSLTGSVSLGPEGPEGPHCQGCISYQAQLKRLSCGHLYCGACSDAIVNRAFQDIEGLCDYPCPVCKALRQLLGPPRPPTPSGRGHRSPHSGGCYRDSAATPPLIQVTVGLPSPW